MLQDVAVPIYRQGFKRYFENGIIPFVRNMAALDFKNNKRLRTQMMDMGIGIDTSKAFYAMNFDLNRSSYIPMNGVEKLAENASHAMGLLNLSSVWGDNWQHVAGTAAGGSIIRDLESAIAGQLEPRWIKRLLNLRINPNDEVAQIIVNQFKKHGEVIRGGYIHNMHLWGTETGLAKEEAKKIARATALFETAIIKDVRSVMFSGSSIASYPIEGEANGILGLFLMYAGWGFNATANFTIPMFQKLDVSRISAAMSMIMISSIVDPLRKLAHGEELTEEDFDGAMMFKKGLLNSGVLGVYGDIFNKANSIGDLFPDARINRYKNTRGLVQFGPERILADLLQAAGMFTTREWNKKDWKKLASRVPLANLIYTRAALNSWIDSFDVANTRNKASQLKEWR
ncbi:MAG TPA: hypothetical protein VNX68_12945, partial [Nitrosopumilaceae archaeon]|nr:hypothetical protein [Nitrosopumilaceae archaeon]